MLATVIIYLTAERKHLLIRLLGAFSCKLAVAQATQALQGGVNQNLTFGLVFNISSHCKLGIILCDY